VVLIASCWVKPQQECSAEASSTVLEVTAAMSFTGNLRVLNSNPIRQKKHLKHGLPAFYMDGLSAGKWVAPDFPFALSYVSHMVNVRDPEEQCHSENSPSI